MLLRREGSPPDAGSYYWARAPVAQGNAFELAGWEPLPSGQGTDAWVCALLGLPEEAELVIYADPARGAFRYAGIVGQRLEACLLLSRRTEDLPAREDFIAALGGELASTARLALLAGCKAGEAGAGSLGRTVCSCFAVGLKTLLDAIAERRLTSVAAIGRVLRAGTNCGSCIPELAAILRGAQP